MKLIDRYVGSQLLISVTMAVSVLSVVLVLGNIFKQLLGLLVKNDTPIDLILTFLAYILPFSLSFTIPWGFLTAVLLVFGKMSAENELVGFRANGVSVPRLCLTVLGLALLCVGICLWINIDVAPRAQAKMKLALYNIVTSNPMAMFGSDRVISDFPGNKIYVERSEGTQLYNLLIYKLNDENVPVKVTFAHRGELETDEANKELLLHIYDARYEQRDDDEIDNLLKIKQGITMQETTLPISIEALQKRGNKGISSMTAGELLDHINQDRQDKTEKEIIEENTAAKTELSKRFSFALASFAFALMGVPLAITAHRKETSVGILLSFVVAAVYFFFIIMANNVREKPFWHPHLLMWVPNILCITFGAWLFRRMSRR